MENYFEFGEVLVDNLFYTPVFGEMLWREEFPLDHDVLEIGHAWEVGSTQAFAVRYVYQCCIYSSNSMKGG